MEYENIRVPISLFTNQVYFLFLHLLSRKGKGWLEKAKRKTKRF
jgi:hypothetical protein